MQPKYNQLHNEISNSNQGCNPNQPNSNNGMISINLPNNGQNSIPNPTNIANFDCCKVIECCCKAAECACKVIECFASCPY